MENMQYAEELVREFLVFRGFTNSLQAFERELNTDIGKGFQVDRILDLIFSTYIPKYEAEKLIGLLTFFNQCFSSSEMVQSTALSKLETSVLWYYVVYAIQSDRKEKVIEFFERHGNDLLQKDRSWTSWFTIPYLRSPSLDPKFRVYFSKEWIDALHLSVRNFLSQYLNDSRIPTLLRVSFERNSLRRMKNDIKQLNLKFTQLQALLEEKEAELRLLRRSTHSEAGISSSGLNEKSIHPPGILHDNHTPLALVMDEKESVHGVDITESYEAFGLNSTVTTNSRDGESTRATWMSRSCISFETAEEMQGEEAFPEVKVDFQETFLGHTSPISRCRFSASGDNIASASIDGTVRIWTYDSSTPASRNATIYCGAEIMSLEWDYKSDRLLLIGTADGGIKAWNVDAKRVVCDLNTTENFPSVLDLKCSPTEPIFVSAAASRRSGTNFIDKLDFASLTVWNMRIWKAVTVLPLGEDPPAITSLCFNHNGKILAAAATDGMIHMFDMALGMQITGWPAHDTPITSVLFGSDETSIFSLGADGKIFEWSLQSQGKVLWSRNCSSLLDFPQEMALDAAGRRLLVTSGSVRAPIYHVKDHTNGMRTLPHSAAISTVDWHPTMPIFLTGSADHSVRVTSIL